MGPQGPQAECVLTAQYLALRMFILKNGMIEIDPSPHATNVATKTMPTMPFTKVSVDWDGWAWLGHAASSNSLPPVVGPGAFRRV